MTYIPVLYSLKAEEHCRGDPKDDVNAV